jgi:hypothetical protein
MSLWNEQGSLWSEPDQRLPVLLNAATKMSGKNLLGMYSTGSAIPFTVSLNELYRCLSRPLFKYADKIGSIYVS